MYEITNTNYQPMQELIKITEQNGNQVVSMKDLYTFLEVRENWTDWTKRMLGYGFDENVDYEAVSVFRHHPNGIGGTTVKDYALTLDCAKEIAMLQRSEKGKMARQYFIECEKQLRAKEQAHQQIPQSFSEALRLAAEQAERIEAQQKQLQAQAPKVLFADAVSASKTSILIGELAKIIKQNGVEMGQNRLFEWLRSNGYLITRQGTDYNMPTQKAMELGLFEIKETSITHSDGHITVNKTPKVTGKGQSYFINKFLKSK
jgi:phage antirepressor protein